MGAKQSQEMRDAIDYVASGMSVIDAAKLAGVNRTALHDAIRKIRIKKTKELLAKGLDVKNGLLPFGALLRESLKK